MAMVRTVSWRSSSWEVAMVPKLGVRWMGHCAWTWPFVALHLAKYGLYVGVSPAMRFSGGAEQQGVDG